MPDAVTPGVFGAVEQKLPLIGKAVAGALAKITDDPNRTAFILVVFDSATQDYAWTSDGQRESILAALAEFVRKHAH